ncbi:hypothetical protein COCOBI_08-3720 [Coccomyxa sp. Obi]|nr:hypothetical protein COCOBI_08-3720 [Coccomyxa sp. Obi]
MDSLAELQNELKKVRSEKEAEIKGLARTQVLEAYNNTENSLVKQILFEGDKKEAPEPILIYYFAEVSKGRTKCQPYTEQTDVGAPFVLDDLRSALEKHFYIELADCGEWSLYSGGVHIKNDNDLKAAIKLARKKYEQTHLAAVAKKKNAQSDSLLHVSLTIVKKSARAFNSYNTELGMAALCGSALTKLPVQNAIPYRAVKPFWETFQLEPLMEKTVDLGRHGDDHGNVKQLLEETSKYMIRSLSIMPWDDPMKEAGRPFHMDPIITTSLVLFATLMDLDIEHLGLEVEKAVNGKEAAGSLDYAIMLLKDVLVMLEAEKAEVGLSEGQLLAQMSAVKDARAGQKRKRLPEGDKVFGLLSNGMAWRVYMYDISNDHPVQLYTMMLDLNKKYKPEEVQKAVQPILEGLVGV